MSACLEDPAAAIEAAIAAIPALNPALVSPDVQAALVTDLAQDIYTKAEICLRYGLDIGQLLDFVRRPGLARAIKERRAIFMSGEGLEARNAAYYGTVALEGAPQLDKIIHGPLTPASTRIDAITLAARISGAYSTGTQKGQPGSTQVGSKFSVNITFSGGRTHNVSTTVEHVPYTAIETAPAELTAVPDDDEFVEPGDDA